jgi:hypothetical protein
MIYAIVEEVVENIDIYMAVAEETAGGKPILNKRGPNIEAPPRPKAPEMNPPKKPKITSFTRVFPINLTSLSIIPYPNLSLSSYSLLTILTAV